ncbi:MAG TPA: hypothetical protein VHW71_18650 [Steroidobacteraceae bacterium]|jgi:hypothetical protein|nr:hypothetical protein [Steroidobacteraceae bacterium]
MADSHSRTLRALAGRAACQLGAARLLIDLALELAIDADKSALKQLLGAQAAATGAQSLMRSIAGQDLVREIAGAS